VAPRWRERADNPHKPTIEQRIGRVASRQLGLVTARQLAAIGLSRSSIADRARSGRLHRLHRGVYATAPRPWSLEQHRLAAVLACGPGSLLSHLPAASHLGMTTEVPLVPEVTTRGGRSRPGIVVHLSTVDPREVRRVGGVPCTSPDRVLVDLAPAHSEQDLELMLVAADSLGILKRVRLAELVAERAGRPGMAKFASLLDLRPQLVRSLPELLFLPIARAAGLPRPLVNHRIAGLTVDFAWPELRMVVEADSQRWHGDWEAAERDRERDQLLALAGWTCHRFVRRRIAAEPAASAQRLRQPAAAIRPSASATSAGRR